MRPPDVVITWAAAMPSDLPKQRYGDSGDRGSAVLSLPDWVHARFATTSNVGLGPARYARASLEVE